MDSPFPDGGPAASYTNALLPGSGQQSPCVLDVSGTEPLYTFCSALHRRRQHQPETGSLPQGAEDPSEQHHLSQVHGCASRDPMTYYQPHQPRTQNHWLPPALNTKSLGRVALQEHASGSDTFHYHPSPVSSGTWPSPVPPYHQPLDMVQVPHPHNPQDCFQTCTPTSGDNYYISDCEVGRPYICDTTESYCHSSTAIRVQQPSPISLDSRYSPAPLPSAAASPSQDLTSTAAPMNSLKREPSPGPTFQGQSTPGESSESSKKSSLKDATKKDEPYAKLIERALRSRADHSMQLQEIYQWFIEHTDKARNYQAQPKESKGWQNSIRHNLSMNAAFTKMDEDRSGPGSGSAADHRRSTVWVLAPWAVRDGVQSTTRYRKANSSRRAGAARSFSQSYSVHLRPYGTRTASGLQLDGGARAPRLHQPYSPGISMTSMQGNVLPRSSFPARPSPRLPYASEPYGPPQIDNAAHDHFKQEHDSISISQTSRPNHHFGTHLPSPMMDKPTSRVDTGSAYVGSYGRPSPLNYSFPQTTFPYGVQDVQVSYALDHNPTTPSSNSMFEADPEGFCGFDENEI